MTRHDTEEFREVRVFGTVRSTVVGTAAATSMIIISLVGITSEPSVASMSHYSSSEPASLSQVLNLVKNAASIHTLPSDLTPKLQNAPLDMGQYVVSKAGCYEAGSATTVDVHSCTFGDPNAKNLMVIDGDSHSAMWEPGLSLVGKRIHWKVVDFWFANCGAASYSYVRYWN